LILRFYITMVLDHDYMFFLLFPWPINCNHAFPCTKSSTHLSPSWFWLKIYSFPWIHGVAHDHILQASNRTNEWRTISKTIPRFDIDPTFSWWKPWTAKGGPHLEVEPLRAWYYHIFPNCRILVILLQVNPTFGDEPKTVYKGFYEFENTSIFAWSSILSIRHYRWLCSLIHQLPPSNKADFLICTIWHILVFYNYELSLWHMTHSQVPCWTHLRVQLCRVVESWDLRGTFDF
jgi:hypothetical protein